MPSEVTHSPPLHRPGDVTTRPKGILKNPSFSGTSGDEQSTTDPSSQPPSATIDPQDSKEITIQNTLQNAGHRRESSAAGRRSSGSRRHSSAAGISEENSDNQRLKWDEANLYLAEQEAGGRMKITEPKTPFEYGNNAMEEDDDEEADVAIDPRFVNVDEVDMAKRGSVSSGSMGRKKARESEIPGLELGEAEDEGAGADVEDDRILRSGSAGGLSRESSKEKHVSVGEDGEMEQVGMPTREEREKHEKFEAQRKKHYEMRNVKDMLGHPENIDEDDDDDVDPKHPVPKRGVNGV